MDEPTTSDHYHQSSFAALRLLKATANEEWVATWSEQRGLVCARFIVVADDTHCERRDGQDNERVAMIVKQAV